MSVLSSALTLRKSVAMAIASPFPSADKKAEQRAAKRLALLRAAARMFNAQGYHATSLDDVAASVGVTKPTIYHYLGNKEQVLLECMTIGLVELQEAAAEARDRSGRAIDRLRAFLVRYAQVNMADFGQCVIRTGDELLSPAGLARMRDLKRPIDAAMRTMIAEGIEEGSIAPCDAKLLAFTIAGALNWPARWYNAAGERSAAELAEAMVAMLATGFAARGEREAG